MQTQTILNIKTDKGLKEEAQGVASALGVPLTTVINSFLKQFVRERKLVLELEPQVKDEVMESWRKISIETKKNLKNSKKFTKAEDLFKHLSI